MAVPASRSQVVSRVKKVFEDGYMPVVVVSAMGRAPDPYATDTLLSLARQAFPDTAPRELDLLASCGEIIASVVMANTLRAAGLDAMAITGGQAGIITNGNFTDARVIRVEPDHLLRHVKEGKIVVVAGFQGVTENGDITTLGRGGSDTTASALGVALKAEVIEIYTDVDGVKTADPRLVPEARTLDSITYDEICQMAHEGAKVIHPRAVEIAMRGSIPLRVKCTFSEAPGTLVTYGVETQRVWPDSRSGKVITGVTHIPDTALIRVVIPESADSATMDRRIFRALADAGISVDLINVSPGLKSFIVKEELADKASRVLGTLGLEPQVRRGCAKVSVVGSGMRGLPGVMANVVEALQEAGVRILQTSDSHVTISCLVASEDLTKAVRALHDRFGLDK